MREELKKAVEEYLAWEGERESDHHSWEGFIYWLLKRD